ncbi:hypothetical protein DOY81_005506 [Sarcophaga bullata]|nr:hypothetical protein DOY81_005506 [Sarcophaga bullata]
MEISAVNNERGTQTIQMTTIFRIIYVVFKKHLKYIENKSDEKILNK